MTRASLPAAAKYELNPYSNVSFPVIRGKRRTGKQVKILCGTAAVSAEALIHGESQSLILWEGE